MNQSWHQVFKLWTYATEEPDPLSRRERSKNIEGAGVTTPEVIPDLRNDGGFLSGSRGSVVRLRDSTDFIDLSSVTNRQSRYKEYDRLRNVAEIETALTVFADESCVTGDTRVATPFGYFPIADLAANKEPDEQFLVYCYDFTAEDYTLGWAFHPRLVKTAKTVKVSLENGTNFCCTEDHRVLKRDGTWAEAGSLTHGDELMPFYRVPANHALTKTKVNQFARIFTLRDGWKSERQFIDEWKMGRKSDTHERVSRLLRYIQAGLNTTQIDAIMKDDNWGKYLKKEGFSYSEVVALNKKFTDRRRVLHVADNGEKEVYDLSVHGHENFATNTTIFHNCQIGQNGHLFEIDCKNKDVREELEFLFFHPKMLNLDRKMYTIAKNLYLYGDHFIELIIDPEEPKSGILKIQNLPADSVYRIETIKNKLLEFQQSKEGPDYQSLSRVEVTKATQAELMQATAIRFTPSQIVHFRIGDDRPTFYPYGVSLIEAARGPAHSLRLMEDAMLVYRLCVVGDTRVRTDIGYKYIKDIVVGDVVNTFITGKVIESTVIDSGCTGVQEVYRVRSQHNEITGTATHPLLVVEDGEIKYVQIKDLKIKHHKLINVARNDTKNAVIPRIYKTKVAKLSPEQKKAFRTAEYANVSEKMRTCGDISRIKQFLYRNGKCLPYDLAVRVCHEFQLNHNDLVVCNKGEVNPERINLPSFVDEDFARLFGFLLGDGYVAKNYLGFSCGTDESVNDKYATLLSKYFGVCTYSPDKRGGYGSYTVGSTTAADIMKLMGYIPGAKNKRIPSWALTATKKIRRALVEGLSDADGCERTTKAGLWFSTIELCNKKLVEDVKEIWHSIGLCSGHVKSRVRNGGHEIVPGRRMKKSISHSVTISERKLPETENVVSVVSMGAKPVYDISVDHDEHNFIANGIPIHNSRAPERRVFYIDVGNLPPFKTEAFMDRMKDTLRKKKTFNAKGGTSGASPVEERWTAMSQDEDFFIPIRPNTNTRVETLPGACLALDTKIPLLDGRTLTLMEIAKEWESGKRLWAYSCDPTNGKPAPGLITWAGVTRRNAQVVKVTFDNGESVVCTPDHKFPIIGKGKVMAKDLTVGASVIPFNTRMWPIPPANDTKYQQIYDVDAKKWVFTHRMVAGFVKGTDLENSMTFCEDYRDSRKGVIHHININRYDNTPDNLTWMNWDDHKLLHNKIGLQGSKVLVNKLKTDKCFRAEFIRRQRAGREASLANNPELHIARGKKISEKNRKFWSDPGNKKRVFDKQTVVYPKPLFDRFLSLLAEGKLLTDVIIAINADKDLVTLFVNENLHLKREDIHLDDGITVWHVKKMVKAYGFKGVHDVRASVGKNVKGRKAGFGYKYPKPIMDIFMKELSDGKSVKSALKIVNDNRDISTIFADANDGKPLNLGVTQALRMVRKYGYEGLSQAREQAKLYNHKVVSVEFLDERIDTGTLTIDGNHVLHDYHNFAISPCGIYTCNSNISEIDDALYFRNKLFIALNFPKNYMAQEDSQITRVTLSSVDVKFARLVERLQMSLADGITEMANRHLELRGFPPSLYEDLRIRFTPPSHYRELSENEVTQIRFDRALAVKGSQIFSDLDVLTRILKIPMDEAKEIVARSTIQKLQELKLQVMAQNPQLMGIAMPGPEGQEMGAAPGGPNPQLTGEEPPTGEQLPGTQPAPPQQPPPEQPMMKKMGDGDALDTYGQPTPPEGQPLPDPEPEDIRKYDLEIMDYSKEHDEEELDMGELDGD